MSIPAVKDHGVSYTPEHEDYCPHRALLSAVIIQAIKDYCTARRDQETPKKVRRGGKGGRHTELVMCKNASSVKREAEAFLCGTDLRAHDFFPYVNMPFATPEKLDKVYTMYRVHGSVSGEAAAAMFRREARESNG